MPVWGHLTKIQTSQVFFVCFYFLLKWGGGEELFAKLASEANELKTFFFFFFFKLFLLNQPPWKFPHVKYRYNIEQNMWPPMYIGYLCTSILYTSKTAGQLVN